MGKGKKTRKEGLKRCIILMTCINKDGIDCYPTCIKGL